MFSFPSTEKKLRSTISRYKSALKKEKKDTGYISDGSGKRYLLFGFYFVLDDIDVTRDYIAWYKIEFLDDAGEPIQQLCLALSLYRMKQADEAREMLAELMLSNLYLIPHIIGQVIQEYDIWHSSNYTQIDYVEYLSEEIKENIKEAELQWMTELYNSFEFRRIRKRYIEIYQQLQHTTVLEKRIELLDETKSLFSILGSN